MRVRAQLLAAEVLAAMAFAATGMSCTLLVADPVFADESPCVADADCRAGRACVTGACTDVPAGPTPSPVPVTTGPAGATLFGPGGVRLEIPPGALSGEVFISLERSSASLPVPGLDEVSPLFTISPPTELSVPARLLIPVTDPRCPDACAVFARTTVDGGVAWEDVPAGTPEQGFLTAAITRFGAYAAASTAAADAGFVDAGDADGGGGGDAGALDAGFADAGFADAGFADAGSTLFDVCDFTAGSCGPVEVCLPDPFDATRGRCLTSAAAGGAACVCARPLSQGGNDICLPADLCGAGGPTTPCPNGVADCDFRTAPVCADLDGAPTCTTPCDAASEASECGADGCCASSGTPGAVGLFCHAEVVVDGGVVPSTCGAAADGSLCTTDGSCASNRCVSHDFISPKRCVTACNIDGSCETGLQCVPFACPANADPICVPEDALPDDDDTLVCGTNCVSDEACSGGFCVLGQCRYPTSCDCFTHDMCAPNQWCRVTQFQRNTCETAEEVPCCGGCLARLSACYEDAHCPPASDATKTTCVKSGCSGPLDQCAGTCEAPAPGACVTSSDCPTPTVCVDHLCL